MPIHRRSNAHDARCVGGTGEIIKTNIPEVMLQDCLSAVTIQRRVLHELLVGGLGDKEDPSQNDILQLSRNTLSINNPTDSEPGADVPGLRVA